MTSLALHLFGYPHIFLDGAPVDMRRRKEIALLAYLATTQRALSRDILADLFWPGYNQTSARGNLRRTLSNVNRSLGNGWMVVDREQVALAQREGLWIDVVVYQDRLAELESGVHDNIPLGSDGLASLQAAVQLYEEDFLAGFSLLDAPGFDMWQVQQTESLRRQLAGALERLARCLAAVHNYSEAIVYARRWSALDPLHEPAQRTLMRLYAQSGDRAAALHQYKECVRVLADELGMKPEAETTSLHEQIRSGESAAGEEPVTDASIAVESPMHSLPEQTTPFVGRAQELAQVERRLSDPNCHLLTIVGPGGIGKTRLAIQAAEQQLERFRDGVYFVDLSAVNSVELIATTILHAVAPDEYSDANARRRLQQMLSDKELLLVLDNFEQLVEGADLLPELLRNAPGLRLLVTSRERLNLHEEWLEPLDGMPSPQADALASDLAQLQSYDATRLFLDCVRRVRPGWQPTESDASVVTSVCRALEGMPLAIELAANWTRALPLDEVSAELARGLNILSTSLRDVPERHRSMQAAFDQSWAMLEPDERSILRQMSVFHGGCTRAAAKAVAGADLAELSSLVDNSWLRLRSTGRYDMHQLVHQYCAEKLDTEHQSAAGETPADVRGRHCAYYAEILRQPKRMEVFHAQHVAQSSSEFDNIQTALLWAAERRYLSAFGPLISGLWNAADPLGWHASAYEIVNAAAKALSEKADTSGSGVRDPGETATVLARTYRTLITLAIQVGQLEKANDLVKHLESLVETMQPGETRRFFSAEIYRRKCHLASREGNYAAMRGYGLEALTRYEDPNFVALGSLHGMERAARYFQADILASIAHANWDLGEYDSAAENWRHSIALADEIEEKRLRAQHCGQLARLLTTVGSYRQAETFGLEALHGSEEVGDELWAAIAHVTLGILELARGNLDLSRQHLARGVQMWRRCHYHRLLDAFAEMGQAELADGNVYAARTYFSEAADGIESYEMANSTHWPSVWIGLGGVAIAEQNPAEALDLFRRTLSFKRRAAWETMEAVAGLAEVAAQEGQDEKAVELLALVVAHPFTAYARREKSRKKLDALKGELTTDRYAARVQAGENRDLDTVLAELTRAEEA